jgi:hypothetical protein
VNSLPTSATILLRRGNKSEPGMFEQVMAKLASVLWINVEWFRPQPTEGRAGTYLRDVEYVRQADLVLAYFSTREMSGGTGHVVEKAVDQDVPVYAYGFDGQRFGRIGEHDSHNAWGGRVP